MCIRDRARDADWVDYSTVTTLKMTALRMAWKGFAQRDDEQMTAFRQFVAEPVSYTHLDVYKRQGRCCLHRHDAACERDAGAEGPSYSTGAVLILHCFPCQTKTRQVFA